MGAPAREIVGLSEKLGVELLIVGIGRPRAVRHTLSAMAPRAALGSAADYIVCSRQLLRPDTARHRRSVTVPRCFMLASGTLTNSLRKFFLTLNRKQKQ